MNITNNQKPLTSQKGAAVLLVSIVLLIGVTLITVFAARIGIMDQRISANEYRHKEAYATSEAGLEMARSYTAYRIKADQSFFDTTDLISCSSSAAFPCGDGASNIYSHYYDGNLSDSGIQPLEQITSLSNNALFDAYIMYDSTDEYVTILSQGKSIDETGSTNTQQGFAKINLLTKGPVPPLMAPVGTLSGNFRIVPNPNGNTAGGKDKFGNTKAGGYPLSLWVDSLTLSGGGASFKTCSQEYYRSGNGSIDGDVCAKYTDETDWEGAHCDCYVSSGSSVPSEIDSLYSAKIGGTSYVDRDIVTGGDFPDSIVKYAFGYDDITELIPASQIITDCDDATLAALNLSTNPFVYIEGDCTVSATQVGSITDPIILLVNGDYTMNGNDKHLWGLVYSSGEVRITGTPTIHGALLSEELIDIGSGTYNQIYDEDVFDNLGSGGKTVILGPVAYSKTDIK